MCRFPKCPEEGTRVPGGCELPGVGAAAELGSCGRAAGSLQLLSLPILSVDWPVLHTV